MLLEKNFDLDAAERMDLLFANQVASPDKPAAARSGRAIAVDMRETLKPSVRCRLLIR